MKKHIKNCNCEDVVSYVEDVLNGKIRTSKEIKKLCNIVAKEFNDGNVEVDMELYEKYLKIGQLFFNVFPYQKFLTALCLCTFYKGTHKTRWNKCLIVMGRGNGKDGLIAWWSSCLVSEYHGIEHYDVDIIANNYTQSQRPINDIAEMVERKNKHKFFEKIGDSVIYKKTLSSINARSSDAKMHDGLRSGACIFNEIHIFNSYDKISVMVSGLGKIDDPRTFYFTTNGDVRGSVLDDMLEKADDILKGLKDDRRNFYAIYKLDDIKEVHDEENWIKANPSLPYRDTLIEQIRDEYDIWMDNPNNMPSFPQKRFNLPIMPSDQEVVPWELVEKTNQEYDYSRLEGMHCILGIDLSKTDDWTAINMLFYDEEYDKYICLNHAFICARNKDLNGIKAPYMDWCKEGFTTLVDEKEISVDMVLDYALKLADDNGYFIEHIVIDDFKKGLMKYALEERGYTKEDGNLTIVRPSNIAPIVPVIRSYFINEQFIWGNNRCLYWACGNTKVIPWKNTKTTGDNDMGNELYGKINPRFRKTDPFMAFVHSMTKHELLKGIVTVDENTFRGF